MDAVTLASPFSRLRMRQNPIPAGSQAERADTAYAAGLGSLTAHSMLSAVLALTLYGPHNAQALLLWLAATNGILALRALDIAALRTARLYSGRPNGAGRDIAIFSAGALATAALWAIFPLLFFPIIGTPERIAAAAMLTLAAAFGPGTLAPSPALAAICGIAQVLPAGFMLLIVPAPGNMVPGLICLAVLPAIAGVSTRAHRAAIGRGRASAGEPQSRSEIEHLTAELADSQFALQQVNTLLEKRVFDRTAEHGRDTGDRERFAEALARLATTDPLTKLPNRAAFVDHLADMLHAAHEQGGHVSLLFIDLDKFKQVNDVRGHIAGDHVLRAAASLLTTHIAAGSLVARWGGDEFVVAMPDTKSCGGALSLAWTLRTKLAAPIEAGSDLLRVDATIGVASFPKDATTHDELIRAADMAMYEGKKGGGGRVKLFDRALAHEAAERHMLEQSLRDAIDHGDFSLAFQPIVSATTGECEAFEALLRWSHPVRGTISPAVFIPVAEQSGQIGAIGRWVLHEACRAAAAWPGDAPPVTVNVSVEQVQSGTLLTDVQDALTASGLPVNRLQLEITESLFAQDQSRVTAVIDALRTLGVRILMDDFGAGYSSLACLSSLPLDVIKIDKSFVQSTGKDGDAFIKAILLIARSLQLRVVAEGIETQVQRDTMQSLGVEMLQGYWFARPMRDDQVITWLRERPTAAAA